ncbi:MAG: hypothetical protein AAFY02_12360 [Pseudomonadota bacterium]
MHQLLARLAAPLCLTALFLVAPTASAQVLLCSAPVTPACVMENYDISADADTERCKTDVEAYVANAQEYSQCLRDAADEMTATSDEVMKQFRCKTGLTEDC